MDRRTEKEARAVRLRKARISAGFTSAMKAATRFGWNYDTFYSHEAGRAGFDSDRGREYAKKFKVDLNWLMLGDGEPERHFIPIMGYVGAGGNVDPDFEQVPDDGIEQIDLDGPIGIVHDAVGFIVRGESMMPKFDDGEILIVEREQPLPNDSMVGLYCVVRLADNRRSIKKVMPGSKRGLFNLVSINAPTVEDVVIVWASPVRIILPKYGLPGR